METAQARCARRRLDRRRLRRSQFSACFHRGQGRVARSIRKSIGLQIGQQLIARTAAQKQIRQLAHFDFLTGLPNRTLFNQLLDHALRKAQRHARQWQYYSSTSMASSNSMTASDMTPVITSW